MRRLAPLLLFLLPALAQKPVLGLALEGQALPIGLVGFARLEQGGTSSGPGPVGSFWAGPSRTSPTAPGTPTSPLGQGGPPLDPAFWEGVPPEGAGFLALVLLRLRVYLEPPASDRRVRYSGAMETTWDLTPSSPAWKAPSSRGPGRA